MPRAVLGAKGIELEESAIEHFPRAVLGAKGIVLEESAI
jgi:hypothetical protein